jgi:superfamily I DNA and RNA helicase
VHLRRGRYSSDYVDGDQGALDELTRLRGEQDPPSEYDTVCIDEAQDLPEFAFRLIEWHTKPSVEWFLAHGPGQELYGTEVAPFMADLLAAAEKDKRIEQLNRVYRTAHVDFLVAQGVFEGAVALADPTA